jgi:hypothetical protein
LNWRTRRTCGPGRAIPENALEIARALINTGQADKVSEAIEKAKEHLEQLERRKMRVAAQKESRHLYHGQVREVRPLSAGTKRDRAIAMRESFRQANARTLVMRCQESSTFQME